MPRDEISLWDYFRIIQKRKKFIILIFGAAILTSAIVSLFSKSVYETSTTLKIGRVKDQLVMNIPETRGLLASNKLLQETIRELGLNTSLNKLRKMIEAKDVPESEDLLTVVVRGESPQEVMETAQTLSSFVLKKHQEIFDQWMVYLREQQSLKEEEKQGFQERLGNFIEDFELDIKHLEEKLNDLRPDKYMEYIFRMIEAKRNLFELKERYRSVAGLGGPAQSTTIFDPAIKPEQPFKKPRITLNIFLAGIGGLMAGVILALLGEYYLEKE